MADRDITKAQKMLLRLIGHNLFSVPCDIDEDVDWREVVQEGKVQAVPLIAFKEYRALPLDEKLKACLQNYVEKHAISNFACMQGHKYLHRLMKENDISYCVLKGVASSLRYPDPLIRSMGDVDFYVPLPYLERARRVLLDDGFEPSDDDHAHHICFKKGWMYLEMHFAPIGHPSKEVAPLFLEYWSDICERASLVKDAFGEYVLPSDFHHGFILLSHFQSHLRTSGIGLRHFCDWAVFVNTFSDEGFVSVFEEKLKRVGLWRLAQALSLAAVRHLGMPYHPWMGADDSTADALIEEVLHGGNFGRREGKRYYEDLFVANSGKGGAKQARILRAFFSLNRIVRCRWRVVEKCPLLYPIGWLYFSLRFLFMLVTGKRKVDLADSYHQSGKRIKLYNSLRLLDPEG